MEATATALSPRDRDSVTPLLQAVTDSRPTRSRAEVSRPWLRAQSINTRRHAAALRPFTREEFGTSPSSPSEGHIKAVNALLASLRRGLQRLSGRVERLSAAAARGPDAPRLQQLLVQKERGHDSVRAIERIWDFYFELFGQRQSTFGDWLLGCDRIALDCYQDAFVGVGIAKSIPAPPPFSYMRTGFSPATFRRGIPLRRLGQQLNPFPLIQLPYHRLVNPWTLGAILHEVSHNLQNDLGLARIIPLSLARRLIRDGHSPTVAGAWTRWNRETFADMTGLLLGGPSIVGSLFDIIARAPRSVFGYNPRGVHPTPYLRAFASIELLGRMGFAEEAEGYRGLWNRLYPNPRAGTIPAEMLDSAPKAIAAVVDSICYQTYATLGNKCLADVFRFQRKDQMLVEEAASRISRGTDPGVVPERYLIGATRVALDRQLASPTVITQNFYTELARR